MHEGFLNWYSSRYDNAGSTLLSTAPADDERFEPERQTMPRIHSVRSVMVGGQSVTVQTRRQGGESDERAADELFARLMRLSTNTAGVDLFGPDDICGAPDRTPAPRPAVPVLLSTRLVPIGGVFVALQTAREVGKGDEPVDWLEWAEE